jgi:hypothetical protein
MPMQRSWEQEIVVPVIDNNDCQDRITEHKPIHNIKLVSCLIHNTYHSNAQRRETYGIKRDSTNILMFIFVIFSSFLFVSC